MKTILAILALCLCLSASTAQIMWTAYTSAVQNTTCDPQNTNFYDVLNLATDSQGRAWQFGGRGCPDSPSYLRYFDRTNRGWTLEWKVGDSEGPESRNDNLIWIDKDNNIYVYGGQTFGNIVLCDFWKYSISSKTWTNLTVADGSLNSVDRGSADATNYPGCRRGSARWYTPDDNSIWIFSGVVTYEDNEFLPDLWRFNMTSQQWTFVAGDLKEVTESTVFSDPLDVTPVQRWGAYSAVDAQYNLWLYGGEFMSDLWMFDRTSGWQHIGGSANISEGFGCGNTYPPITGNFSSEIQPACAAYSSMTYAGSNILALWTSYTSSGSLGLWLYNITSKQWANFDGFNSIAVADVLYLPDESTSPGYVEYTRAHAHGSIWIVSDDSYGVFVMDLQCLDLVNPCSELATCTLNPSQPAPTCTCTEGYEGDGVTCSLIPPVAPSAAPTSVSTPTNIPIGSKTSSTSRIVAALSSVLALFVWAL